MLLQRAAHTKPKFWAFPEADADFISSSWEWEERVFLILSGVSNKYSFLTQGDNMKWDYYTLYVHGEYIYPGFIKEDMEKRQKGDVMIFVDVEGSSKPDTFDLFQRFVPGKLPGYRFF